MFIHPITALELASERWRDEERRVRVREQARADTRKVRPPRKGR